MATLCKEIYDWLSKDPENVVAVHCYHGKNRTGTIIASYLMYCGLADCVENAMVYFRQKRFGKAYDKGMKHVC